MSTDDRPSISALRERIPYRANLDWIVDLRNAAAVLIEIASAALEYMYDDKVPRAEAFARLHAACTKVSL